MLTHFGPSSVGFFNPSVPPTSMQKNPWTCCELRLETPVLRSSTMRVRLFERALDVRQIGLSYAWNEMGGVSAARHWVPFTVSIAATPQSEQWVVARSNYRRVLLGHALTVVGILGFLTATAGAVLLSQGVDRYKGLKSKERPLSPEDQKRYDELQTQRKVGFGLIAGGAMVGVGGMIGGPLLVRSGRRREFERQRARRQQVQRDE